ncbi:glycosyltransferase family 2 protein [Shewanella morhuae]|uniref:Hyaluronan synthase n=1 Tax=Shewanella morhuae TaxID=365591 RepID=A0A380A704_9GAMM|nr:glycosyltransferase family 2 protein [Shewanella morhuae]SUI75460.1 Hyaluronan synthase [Shewanella morhuae]
MTINRVEPLVSIIIPSFNCESSVARTIESVLNQSYKNWEIFIADDFSTDNTCKVIQNFIARDDRITLIKRSWNAGPAVTRNRAISCANGRYIAFLDADDSWYKNKLEEQIKFMQKNDIALSYTSYRRIHEDGRELGFVNAPKSVTYYDILKKNRIGCLTACYDTEKLGKVYMPNISKRQDLGLWLKILKRIDKAYGLQECLADYNVGVSSVSSNKIVAAKYQWRLYREIEKLPFRVSLYYFLHYVYNSIASRI